MAAFRGTDGIDRLRGTPAADSIFGVSVNDMNVGGDAGRGGRAGNALCSSDFVWI